MSKFFENQEVKELLSSLKNSISVYIIEEDCADELYDEDIDLDNFSQYPIREDAEYSLEDIKQTMQYMDDFLQKVEAAQTRDEAMLLVKEYILKLNELNEKTDYAIFETDQREDICGIIIQAMYLKGFAKQDEDVTEEWRNF